jgi:hypothetical protein
MDVLAWPAEPHGPRSEAGSGSPPIPSGFEAGSQVTGNTGVAAQSRREKGSRGANHPAGSPYFS